ncbi:hypothetical protein M436DRAFT_67711 [Aureobasidium namibiae CBS 147.97]|uniref:Protein kinase domain-containing protein n=1 Tax=Aureobasidium namibiae CBS 147.97 TaxID=1043004 RepID=A0A074W803_9PEZI
MSNTSDAESSSHKSSRSTTPDSTSTYRYSHEPFDTFGEKVRALAPDIGAKSVEEIVRLPGGSFNRIIAATLYRHDPAAAVEKVVLRIPRFAEDGDSPNEDMRTQFAILEALERFGVGVGQPESKTKTKSTSSLQELLSTQLDAWVQHELSNPRRSFVVDMFRRLQEMYTEMEELGFFQERPSLDSNVLYHWDLEPRNIMVDRRATDRTSDITTSYQLEVTGVLDWDDVFVVPSILARKPPVWLWDFSEDESLPSLILAYYDGDVDLLPPELSLRPAIVCQRKTYSPASREAYLDDAYGRGRWLRRLWRFALDGFSDSQHIDRFKNFDEAWSEYKETSSGF